jgi:D-serine deaminase-like pyridoxal phosphate-dependent protein
MTDPTTYPQAPVELPIDPWLYSYEKRSDCGVCVVLDAQCQEALRKREQQTAYDTAAEIRNHPVHDRRPTPAAGVRAVTT